eukprot:scaffold499_cov335-Pavlova_lutheri.AAC.22
MDRLRPCLSSVRFLLPHPRDYNTGVDPTRFLGGPKQDECRWRRRGVRRSTNGKERGSESQETMGMDGRVEHVAMVPVAGTGRDKDARKRRHVPIVEHGARCALSEPIPNPRHAGGDPIRAEIVRTERSQIPLPRHHLGGKRSGPSKEPVLLFGSPCHQLHHVCS